MKDLICNIRYLKGARVVFCDRDEDVVGITYRNVIQGIRNILQFFSLKPGFPLVNIFVAPNRKEYDKLVAHLSKTPTAKGRVGQTQGHDLYIVSPHAWPSDAHSDYLKPNGSFDRTFYRQFLEHEIVHMVEESSSPKMPWRYGPSGGAKAWLSMRPDSIVTA